jgi:hypothetical protein
LFLYPGRFWDSFFDYKVKFRKFVKPFNFFSFNFFKRVDYFKNDFFFRKGFFSSKNLNKKIRKHYFRYFFSIKSRRKFLLYKVLNKKDLRKYFLFKG